MLPVVDRPAIEYIAREAGGAGLDDLLLITRSGKDAIEEYFDADPGLEHALEQAGRPDLLDVINEYQRLPRFHTTRQGHPLGLGHAVAQARHLVGDEPFAVLLPDDLMHPEDPILSRMIAVRQALGGSVVALLRVTPEEAGAYGSAEVTPVPVPEGVPVPDGELVRVGRVVEKPRRDQVLSDFAVVGRYVFDPAIFPILDRLRPGRGGEIQLTDGIDQLTHLDPSQGGGVYGVVIRGRRFDTGDKLGYIEANVELALEDRVLGPGLRQFLGTLLATHGR